jgi:ABC-type multidrug transport system ATPase subunit
VLEIRGLAKSFEGRTVLDGIDLTVGAGESVALLGANGSGKTTTLRCVVGLTVPDAGRILVDGVDALREGERARRRLSYMPQRCAFPATLRVREAIAVVARLRGCGEGRDAAELAACGLAEAAGRFVGELSGGQRQRLALAIALLPDVPLYLFDEPSANLDAGSLDVFRRRARALRADGRTVLFTTHAQEDVDALASRVVRLQDGRPAADGDAGVPAVVRALVVHLAAPAQPWAEAARELGAESARAQGRALHVAASMRCGLALLRAIERAGESVVSFEWGPRAARPGREGGTHEDTVVGTDGRGGLRVRVRIPCPGTGARPA